MTGPKYCMNYESGEYEWIEENGFSIDQGEFVYNWDDSEYQAEREEEEEEERRRQEEYEREEEERRLREEEECHNSFWNDEDEDY